LGRRLTCWPGGVPEGSSIGIVSSRLGRDLDRHRGWFAVLRTACMRMDREHDLLLTARSTTTQRFVRRCGRLFGLRVLCIDTAEPAVASPAAWGRRVLLAPSAEEDGWQVLVSPPYEGTENSPADPGGPSEPMRDAALVAASDRLVALHVRCNGNLQRLLNRRLADAAFAPASVFLALGNGLNQPASAAPLLDHGAVGWYLQSAADSQREEPFAARRRSTRRRAAILGLPGPEEGQCLTHCTRRRRGPWPGQREEDFLDDLILDRAGADHSPLAALYRIVRQRKLIASADLVRGDQAVVSLTEVPVRQLHRFESARAIF
jgi:hypothetical protein